MSEKAEIVAVFSATITLRRNESADEEAPIVAKVETLVEEVLADETGFDVNVEATRADR